MKVDEIMSTVALGLRPFGEDDFLDLRMLRRFQAFEALGSLDVFGPDQLLLLFSNRLINSTEALRKRFVHLNCNLAAGDIFS